MFAGRATSDLHLTERTSTWVWQVLKELCEDSYEREGPTILVGDIFDQAIMAHVPTFNRLRHELNKFKGEVYLIAGNHDQYDGRRNILESFSNRSIHVISDPTWTAYGLMLPYLPPDEFWKTITKMKKAKPKTTIPIWWTHQGWYGSLVNNMLRDSDGLSLKKISTSLVISGHYHCPQNIAQVIYCGSPYQITFAEEGQHKGWLRFDPDSEYPTRQPFKYVTAPRHHTIHWDPETGQPKVPKDYSDNDKLRIVTQATRNEIKAKWRSVLSDAGLDGVPILAKRDTVERGVIDHTVGAFEAARQYVDVVFKDDKDTSSKDLQKWAEKEHLWIQNQKL